MTISSFLKKAGVSTLAFALLVVAAPSGFASNENVRTITVNGQGTTTAPADTATLNLSMNTFTPGERSASVDQVNKAFEQVKSVFAESGVTVTLARIQYFNTYPSEQYPVYKEGEVSSDVPMKGFQTDASFEVRFKFSSDTVVESIKEKLLSIEGVNAPNFSYGLKDDSEYIEKSRKMAANTAMQKANVLAKIFGVELGSVLNISETSYNQGYYPYGGGYYSDTSEVMVSVDISVTFEIKTSAR